MPNRILREGILTSQRMARLGWADLESLKTEAEVLAVRDSLPVLKGGDPLQAYKWSLSTRLRRLRARGAGPVDNAAVRRLFAEAGNDCPSCGESMADGAKRKPSLDHRVALANGGTNAIENLRIICNRCNSRKSDRA